MPQMVFCLTFYRSFPQILKGLCLYFAAMTSTALGATLSPPPPPLEWQEILKHPFEQRTVEWTKQLLKRISISLPESAFLPTFAGSLPQEQKRARAYTAHLLEIVHWCALYLSPEEFVQILFAPLPKTPSTQSLQSLWMHRLLLYGYGLLFRLLESPESRGWIDCEGLAEKILKKAPPPPGLAQLDASFWKTTKTFVTQRLQEALRMCSKMRLSPGAICLTRVPIGEKPTDMCLSPEEDRLYVTNRGSHSVSVLQVNGTSFAPLLPLETVALGQGKDPVQVLATAHTVFVLNQGDKTVSILKNTSNSSKIVGKIALPLPLPSSDPGSASSSLSALICDSYLVVLDPTATPQEGKIYVINLQEIDKLTAEEIPDLKDFSQELVATHTLPLGVETMVFTDPYLCLLNPLEDKVLFFRRNAKPLSSPSQVLLSVNPTQEAVKVWDLGELESISALLPQESPLSPFIALSSLDTGALVPIPVDTVLKNGVWTPQAFFMIGTSGSASLSGKSPMGTLYVINPQKPFGVTTHIPLGIDPVFPVLSPNKDFLFVSNKGSGTLSVIRCHGKIEKIATLPSLTGPGKGVFCSKSQHLFILNQGEPSITAWDLAPLYEKFSAQ